MATNMHLKDILDALDDLGYQGLQKNGGSLAKAVEDGVSSRDYTDLICWLSSELKLLCNLEEQVHPVANAEDEGAFLVELSSFIRELGCPYPALSEGPVSQRLSSVSARLELLNFLITELLAARISVATKKEPQPSAPSNKAQVVESSTAFNLKSACIALGFPKPPDTITSQQLFSKLLEKVKEHLSKIPNRLRRPLFMGALNEKQWLTVEQLNDGMKMEYKIRAEVLLQRLDVTVQSFSWSDRVKKKEDELLRIYKPIRQQLRPRSTVTIGDILAARDDLTLIEKTASTNLRAGTATKLNKLMIKNRPPDRGGRPTEIEPPPPEMPPWQKRAPGGGAQFGGAPQTQRQPGGRGSGRVQGGGWQGDQNGGRGGYAGGRQDTYNQGYQQYPQQQQQAYGGGYGAQQYADRGHYQQQNYSYQQQQQNFGYQQQPPFQQGYPQQYQAQPAYGGGDGYQKSHGGGRGGRGRGGRGRGGQ